MSPEVQLGLLYSSTPRTIEGLPTGFIVTGPNIASQDLLFQQLSVRLRKETNDPVVVVRSGDAPNLKATLKQIIRDATSQIPEGTPVEQYAAQDVCIQVIFF